VHVVPHVPQLAGSLEVSTQELPHFVVPPAQLSAHAPAEQTCPGVHAVPQTPQLSGSLVTSTQPPLHDVCVPVHATADEEVVLPDELLDEVVLLDEVDEVDELCVTSVPASAPPATTPKPDVPHAIRERGDATMAMETRRLRMILSVLAVGRRSGSELRMDGITIFSRLSHPASRRANS